MEPNQLLSCHLEGVDSVRTGAEAHDLQAHRDRLYAEAFVQLLLGDTIHIGQVPLFDSVGLTLFIDDFVAAEERAQQQQKGYAAQNLIRMYHYPRIGDCNLTDPATNILQKTLLVRMQQSAESFRFSSMAEVNDNASLRDWLASKVAALGHLQLDDADLSELGGPAARHMRRLRRVDRYLSRHTDNCRLNNIDRQITLPQALQMAMDHSTGQDRFESQKSFYRRLLHDHENFSRSVAFDAAEKLLPDASQVLLAKEMLSSLYMWNEARVSNAQIEATSIGFKPQDAQMKAAGDAINGWADSLKGGAAARARNDKPLRPLIHRTRGDSHLHDSQYRAHLCDRLLDHLANPDLRQKRQRLIPDARQRGDLAAIRNYWSAAVELANETFSGTLQLRVKNERIVICEFKDYEVAMLPRDFPIHEDTLPEMREQIGGRATERSLGNVVPLEQLSQ